MAKYTKPDYSEQWASAGNIVAPNSAKIQAGHIVEKPNYEYMNWLQNRQDTAIAYSLQMGIPEWDNATQYQYTLNSHASYIQRNGVVYKAIQTGTNKDPLTEAAYWAIAFDDKGSAAAVQSNLSTHITNYGTLTGLTNTTTARTNLDVYSKAEAAEKNGDATKLFRVANGTTGNEAVNFTQLATKADKNGSAAQEFAVATATTGNSAVNLTQLLNIVYPVGSVYISKTDNRNPNAILGVGTWIAVEGKTLFGYKALDADFGTAGTGGGSKNLSLTMTVESRTSVSGGQAAPATEVITNDNTFSGYMNTGDRAISDDIDFRFKLSEGKILPPYDTFYIWERIS